jgi:hypothetical protein
MTIAMKCTFILTEMPTFEEILQVSKFIFKISEMRGQCSKVSYFNAVITVITDNKKSEKKSLTNHP